jgi:hypothetical protein
VSKNETIENTLEQWNFFFGQSWNVNTEGIFPNLPVLRLPFVENVERAV